MGVSLYYLFNRICFSLLTSFCLPLRQHQFQGYFYFSSRYSLLFSDKSCAKCSFVCLKTSLMRGVFWLNGNVIQHFSISAKSSVTSVQCCVCVLCTWPKLVCTILERGVITGCKTELLAQTHVDFL